VCCGRELGFDKGSRCLNLEKEGHVADGTFHRRMSAESEGGEHWRIKRRSEWKRLEVRAYG